MIVNLSILFYLLVCFYCNSVDSFQDSSIVNEEYRRHIFPPSGEARNLIEERICRKRRYWATACKQIFRKIRETDAEYRYLLYVNYPRFPDTKDGSNCEQHTLWFSWLQDSTEELLQYILTYGVEQMMIPCFNTEASVPSDTEENNVVPNYIDFWIYPGTGTSWMLIKYNPDVRKFFLVDWFNDIQISDCDLVPLNIFSLPIPKSTTNKNKLIEKLSAADQRWSKWQRDNRRANKNILSIIKCDHIITLCVALIGQYLYEKGELYYPYLKIISSNTKRCYIKIPIIVHIEQPEETCENDESTSGENLEGMYNVYIGQSDRNQWKQIGVTMGYRCPVVSSPYIFMLAWGTNENSVLLVRLQVGKRKHKESENEIVKIIENVHELHLRHLYFNYFV